MGLFYQRQGQDETALSYLDQALTLRNRKLGPDHPDTARTRGALALVYQHQGQTEKATQSYDQAMTTLTQRLGAQHPDTRRLVEEYQGLQKERTREYGIEGQRLDGIHGLESG